jgi:hypothetical protein
VTDAEGEDPGPARTPTTNRKAIYSVVCGVLAFACIYVSPFGGLVIGVPSVTSGVHARREIAASKGQQVGDSLAVIGLMIGGGAIVTVVLAWLLEQLA